jgi:hypothetical protein
MNDEELLEYFEWENAKLRVYLKDFLRSSQDDESQVLLLQARR